MTSDRPHTVVVDATAGEEDGAAALRAAATASLDLAQDVIVVGDESDLTAALAELAHDAERLRVVHAPDRLPSSALSQTVLEAAPRSAIPVALSILASRPDASFVTAGPPGAVVRAAESCLSLLPGIERSALAAVVPTVRVRGTHDDPFALVLDVGAHARATADDLVAFARMGAAYARRISDNEQPTVALLSHSRNPKAVARALAQAHRRLVAIDAEDASFAYLGLMRADRIPLGDADVIVTEGAGGNIVIRTLEGVAATAQTMLQRASERFTWRVGVSMLGAGMDRLRTITHWGNYGGAPLLGVDRTVVLTHEEAGERALLNGIRLAAKIERLDVRAALAR